MAITYTLTEVDRHLAPRNNFIDATLAVSGTYTTGGDAVPVATQLGSEILAVKEIEVKNPKGYQANFVPAVSNAPNTGKIMWYHVDNDGVADSAMIEVPNATDISAIGTVRVRIKIG